MSGLDLEAIEARANDESATGQHAFVIDARRIVNSLTAEVRELRAAVEKAEDECGLFERTLEKAHAVIVKERGRAEAAEARVSGLKYAMGDSAGWFDRYQASRSEVDALRVTPPFKPGDIVVNGVGQERPVRAIEVRWAIQLEPIDGGRPTGIWYSTEYYRLALDASQAATPKLTPAQRHGLGLDGISATPNGKGET